MYIYGVEYHEEIKVQYDTIENVICH